MQFVDLPQNPLPPGATLVPVTVGRVVLRVARWAAPERPGRGCPGTVVVCPGRAEFIEKYAEVVRDLLGRGFAVVVIDWRGQGGSSRPLRNPRKGHVRSFGDYGRDLDAVGAAVLEPACPKPWFALAHSMGGTVLAHHARAGGLFDRVVLSAPMLAIAGLRAPRTAAAVAWAAAALGYGGSFVPSARHRSALPARFEGNALTSDPARHAAMAALGQAAPQLLTGGPTWGWLHAAFRAMAPLLDDEVPRRIAVPFLVVAAGCDRIVDTRATEQFALRLKAGHLIVLPGAEHELLMERDDVRDRFWAAFDAFIPGAAMPRAEPRPGASR